MKLTGELTDMKLENNLYRKIAEVPDSVNASTDLENISLPDQDLIKN